MDFSIPASGFGVLLLLTWMSCACCVCAVCGVMFYVFCVLQGGGIGLHSVFHREMAENVLLQLNW